MTGDIAKAKATLPLPASMQMNRPVPQKQSAAVIGGLMLGLTSKTRPTAEGGTKKRRFYRPLPTRFRHNGFDYRQIARERDAAIYEQRWTGCPDAAVGFEVVRVRRRDRFQISEKFIEPYEVYPNSDAWGLDGFTFTDRNKAFGKFLKFRWKNQQGQEGR